MKTLPGLFFLIPGLCSAVTLSFGPLGGPSAPIPGSGGITYTTTAITGGTGTNGSSTGTVTPTVGGPVDADGTFFNPLVDGDPSLTTSIQGNPRPDLGNSGAEDYGNYVGLCVEFSSPIPMYAFGFLDLDAREWASSFAYNSTGAGTILTPTVTLGDTGGTELQFASAPAATPTMQTSTDVDWDATDFSIPTAPTTNPVVFSGSGAHTPNAPEGQIVFDYGGASVTNLYFLFGLNNSPTNVGEQNSGVTGFSVIEPANVIPEPSRAVLLLVGVLASY